MIEADKGRIESLRTCGFEGLLVVSTNPFEKYAQVKLDSSSPRIRDENKKIFELPPPRKGC